MKNVLSLFFLLFFLNVVIAQQPNDCVNALTICGNGAFYSNASGGGNDDEINSCGGFENNSLWLEIHIAQGGTLGFNLIPDDPSVVVDYDFWVFGPNAVCGALGSPIRCATTNPLEAGMSNNFTGMNGSSLLTQTGPGSDGNGYVRWLTVSPGQSYYIAIDRPSGDGGFQIQWTGTANAGTGAFPTPPTANTIPDVLTCSNTPNIGIFDLNAERPLINADTTNNTITFHNSIADASDNVNSLPNIYANISNPETVYVRVTDNITGCFTLTNFDLVVNLVPNASVSISNASICEGDSITVTFTGTPNSTINYTVDSGPIQSAILNAAGIFSITESPTLNRTYTLTNVRIVDTSGNTVCSQVLNQSVSVTVNQLPVVTISGTTSICSGNSTVITFTGTPNAVVTYTVDSGPNQTIVLNSSGIATVTTPLLTANSIYNLVNVFSSGTPVCSQLQTGSATVTVSAIPTASIFGTTTICSGTSTIITFNGTPNATVTYTINGGANQTLLLNNSGNATLNTTNLTLNTVYALVSVAIGSCGQSQSGSAIITISTTPTATISGATTICSGTATVITFNGTPNATVTYTINGGSVQTILLDGTGVASFTTPPLTVTTTYDLISATSTGTPACNQSLLGSAIVNVTAIPIAAVSGLVTKCAGSTAVVIFNGTPNATITYNVNGGANQTIALDATGEALLTTPVLTTNLTYNLISVTTSVSPFCSRTLTTSGLVRVIPLPTATIAGSTSICSGNTAVITFTGTPNATVFYTVDGGPNQVAFLDGTGISSLSTPVLTVNSIYNLAFTSINTTISSSSSISCSSSSSGSAVVSVSALPTVFISGTTTICSGSTTVITFNGTPNAVVTYTVDSGVNQTIVLDGTGVATITTPTLTSSSIYSLVDVTSPGILVCSQSLTDSAIVTVNPLPSVTVAPTLFECSNGSSPTAEFDLTINEGTVTNGVTGLIVTYYNTLSAAQAGSPSIGSPSTYIGTDNEVVYIRVENSLTGCYSTTTQLLRVTQGPVAITPLPLHYCDPNNDGYGVFDLDSTSNEITGTPPGAPLPLGVSVTFHETPTDALLGANPKPSPYPNIFINTQTIYVRVFYTLTGCANYVQLQLIVDPTPVATEPDAYELCDYTGAVGYETFD
ncbi:beta strand repeat-containing protein, partial [Flavobacterium paronense]